MNVHSGLHPRREFDDWQIEVIRRVVDPRAWEVYESLGYARPEFVAGSAQPAIHCSVGPQDLLHVERCNAPDGVTGTVQSFHFQQVGTRLDLG